jgi:hypothetical protein
MITSCGLRPLSDFEKNSTVLTSISIGHIAGENSHLIANYLNNALNIYDIRTQKLYTIDLTVTSTIANAIIQKDSTILEKTITLSATYILKDIKTSKELEKRTIITRSNFLNTTSPYGSFVQEQKAYKEALQISINNIKKHLLLFFAKEYKNNK